MVLLTRILPAALLALGLAGAGYLAGKSLVESRLGFRTVTVKGLAEREVKSDFGFLPLRFTASGDTLEIARGRLETSHAKVVAFLAAQGFAEGEAEVQNIMVQDTITNYGGGTPPPDSRFVLTEDLIVKSSNVDQVAAAARGIGDLLKQGVVFATDSYSAGPSYIFTGVNALKGEMLTEATQRAREAADKFAVESGAAVGDIQNANQGVITISPSVEIPNDRPEKQMMKKVRVVTTITYFLKG
ncbi:MAG: SIMPL domain-containing protein [Rhizobiaceae bacterium]|jgi:hypothetical protein|nr:SIMPL domain-containing protein [Rhizobiaceae bacterium]